jgi:hypothetical protein
MATADRQLTQAVEAAESAGKDLPPALEGMLEDRRSQAESAVSSARQAAVVSLPPATWHEIEQRALTTGIAAELSDGGGTLRLRVDVGATSGAGETADAVAAVD